MSVLKIQFLRPGAMLPKRQTQGSAGYDLHVCLDAPITLDPGKSAKLPTALAIQLEDSGCVGLLFARSSLAVHHGITLANTVGVVDSDYRGEMFIVIKNNSDVAYTVNHGDRIAQLVIVPITTPEIQVCEQLDSTSRGEGGFGSTGNG